MYGSALERFAGDEVCMGLFLDEVRLKARDHARSPVQVGDSFLSPSARPSSAAIPNYH
jgi:hypothetical protein